MGGNGQITECTRGEFSSQRMVQQRAQFCTKDAETRWKGKEFIFVVVYTLSLGSQNNQIRYVLRSSFISEKMKLSN